MAKEEKTKLACVGCSLPLDPKKDQLPVYGEWDCEKDYLRPIGVGGIDRERVPSSFDLQAQAAHPEGGCLLGWVFDVQQSLMDNKLSAYYHMLFRFRHRMSRLPVVRKPGFEALAKFHSTAVGLTDAQYRLLDEKYPFLRCEMRRGRDFISPLPGEADVFSNGDAGLLRTLNLQAFAPHVVTKITKPQGNNDPSAYVHEDVDGDADQDSDEDVDLAQQDPPPPPAQKKQPSDALAPIPSISS